MGEVDDEVDGEEVDSGEERGRGAPEMWLRRE